MNTFRLAADMLHLLALLILPVSICRTRSCARMSGKTQLMFAAAFTTRYLDLVTNFISPYNTVMKVAFLMTLYFTLYLIYIHFRRTYDRTYDNFHMWYLLIIAAILAIIFTYEYTILEILWAFSIFLEAVAILPQLWMILEMKESDTAIRFYLIALATYRALYLCNWAYRYYTEGYFDLIAICGGFIQTFFYVDYFCGYDLITYVAPGTLTMTNGNYFPDSQKTSYSLLQSKSGSGGNVSWISSPLTWERKSEMPVVHIEECKQKPCVTQDNSNTQEKKADCFN